MYVVLVYDVSQQENGAKRWLKIFKICKRYLTHIQNSVFEGEPTAGLDPEERVRFKSLLRKIKNDKTIIISMFLCTS